MAFPKRVLIREVGPREGFQILSRTVPTEKKLELITALLQTGVPVIEVTSFVRPDRVPQLADAEELVKRLPAPPEGTAYTALYLNKKGFERAEASRKLANEGWLYTAASETFLSKNNNCTFDDTLVTIPEWLETFTKAGKKLRGVMVSTAFWCVDEGKIGIDKLERTLQSLAEKLAAAGVTAPEICLADTVGRATPVQVKEALSAVRKISPGSEPSLHLHDTYGTAMANAYAGLEEGVRIFEASVGGMGGCPFARGAAGNIATEDFIHFCHDLDIETGIDLARYREAAAKAEEITGEKLPGRINRTRGRSN